MAKLTREQIDRVKKILDENGELPPELRWELFPPEKQEYELVYGGKQREEKIISETMAVPLQDVRTFNNGSDRTKKDQWYNRLIFGDNLQAMKSLLDDPNVAGKVKLIYIDPPFATKQEFQGSQDQKAYQDKVAGANFIEFLRKRLVLLRQLLSPEGFLILHLDYRYVSHFRIIMDELFEKGNFRNEILLKRSTKSVQSQFENISSLAVANYTLLFYSRTVKTRIKKLTNALDAAASGKWDTYWRSPDRPTMRYEVFGITPEKGQWRWEPQRGHKARDNYVKFLKEGWKDEDIDEYYLDHLAINGEKLDFIRLGPSKSVQYYVPPRTSKISNNVWMDIPSSSRQTGYPTEKSEALLKRIIAWLTDKNEIVLDAFAGSGTTLAVAEKLERRWIGVDCGKLAIYTIQKRLLNLKADVGNKGEKFVAKPFVLQNAGLYDFATLKELPWEDWRFFALQLFECHDKPHEIGNLKLDGLKGTAPVLVYDWKSKPDELISEETIADIHAMIGKKIGKKFYIIAPIMAFDFFQDYIDKDGVRYYALRIPYNMIKELHSRDFKSVLQAREASNVNDIQEAYGFSFMVAPEVEWEAFVKKPKGQLFKTGILKTKKFKSHAWIKGEAQKGEKETLAMLMVDLNYDGKVFDLDKAFYGEELEANNWEALFSVEDIGEKIMAVWTDHHGNESKAIIPREKFGLSKAVNTKRGKNAKK